MVMAWWASVWRSPMAGEYLNADMMGGLYLLADLHQLRWESKGRDLIAASAEIRLQEVRFGLSPIDRRRLQWDVEQPDVPAVASQARKTKRPARKRSKKKDPRDVLKIA